MNKQEFLATALKCEINDDRLKQVESLYKVNVNEIVAKIISFADTVDFFDEERRALSYDEIINASSYFEIDVVDLGIIPLIDVYDCSYLVYLTKEDKWARFSTVDKIVYMKKVDIIDVI